MINQKPPRESDEQRIRREREEQRADTQVTENLQDLLTGQTRRFRQRFGVMRNQSPSGPLVGQFLNQILASQAGAAAGGGGGFVAGLGRGGGGGSLFPELMREA